MPLEKMPNDFVTRFIADGHGAPDIRTGEITIRNTSQYVYALFILNNISYIFFHDDLIIANMLMNITAMIIIASTNTIKFIDLDKTEKTLSHNIKEIINSIIILPLLFMVIYIRLTSPTATYITEDVTLYRYILFIFFHMLFPTVGMLAFTKIIINSIEIIEKIRSTKNKK